jgi:hypothetical protein
MEEVKDPQLWKQAKERADFKIHLTVYAITMATLWIVWFFTGGIDSHPWPIYPTAGWGVGVIFNYLGVFRFAKAADREYEKLKAHHK